MGVHAAVLFGWSPRHIEQAEFGVEMAASSVEVSLVAALPDEDAVSDLPVEPDPDPEPLPPEPEPIPAAPPEPEIVAEMTSPEPLRPTPPPEPRRASSPPPAAKPLKKVARASGDGSSAKPGSDATTLQASAGALSGKPGYLRNPHPAYPDEARRSGQQGLVQIRVRVGADGSVVSASLTRSSSFPLLDERALSTIRDRWRFKPARVGGTAVMSEVIVPVRFALDR